MQRDLQSEAWYIHVDGQPRGPLAIRDLDVLLRTNEITSKTLGYRAGMKQWKPLIQIEEIKDSIKESFNEIIEISQKKTMFDQKKSKFGPKQDEKPVEEPIQENLDNKEEDGQDPMTVIAATVENLVKNSFHQNEDGKWNIYDEVKKEWLTQVEQPKQQIEAFKSQLLSKLKTQLFSNKKETKRRREGQAAVEPEILTKQQLEKREKNRKKAKRAAQKKKQKWYSPKINTFIYISGLPPDITEEELKEFASKAGVIRIDHQTGKEKIKIYKDQQGIPKGDAAISYAKQQSINIALEMLSEREIKPGFKVIIERAQFNQKNESYKPRDSKKANKVNKVIAKKNEEKQLTWQENEGLEGLKIVILKNMFTPDQLSNEQLLTETKEDIKTQCQKIGQLQRIRFFETHPEGVVEVKFKEEAAAEKCIDIMNGRFFDGRQIECFYWDGQTNYKTSVGTHMIETGRMDEFGNWLEQQVEANLIPNSENGGTKKIHVIQLSLEDLEKDEPVPVPQNPATQNPAAQKQTPTEIPTQTPQQPPTTSQST